jgi:hypothetical protein
MDIVEFKPDALEQFKKISDKQWWAIFGRQGSWYHTVDHDKYAYAIYNLSKIKRASDWVIGRFVVELQKQIQKEHDEWDKKYYKDQEKKPEYTSAEKWFDDHYKETRLSWRSAKRHRWVYLNIDPEFSDLGYRKNKTIDDLVGKNEELKKYFRRVTKDKNLDEEELERLLYIYYEKLEEEAKDRGFTEKAWEREATQKILNRLEKIEDYRLKNTIKIKKIYNEGKTVLLECANTADAEFVRDAIISTEDKILFKAYRLKKLGGK